MPKQSQPSYADPPLAFDCFAGCGGMSQGFRDAGCHVIGAIESDPDIARVYSINHPDTVMWTEDIRGISAARIKRRLGIKKGELDLLGGCPPCQGFSTLRTYNGSRRIRDSQNDLIFEFERLARDLLPKSVMLENVPALFHDVRLRRFIALLTDLGYEAYADILDVSNFGVPQRRRRLIVLASRVSQVRFARALTRPKTVRDAIGALPAAGQSGDDLHDLPETRSQTVRERIRQIPIDGGSRSSLSRELQLRCHDRVDGFNDVYGRMAWDQPAPTITTGCFNPSKGRFLHPVEHRNITIREASLLQTFPRQYRFPVEFGKVKLATMIGNALPPQFIKRHTRELLRSTAEK
jgi:DNA (cytosine-5)-methyltransferase 1